MDYEEKVPQFALVPAKAPNQFEFVELEKIEEKQVEEITELPTTPINVKGIYEPFKVSQFRSCKCKSMYIEEDILVPDTKPDLKEILLIDGVARNITCKVEALGAKKIKVNAKGEMCIQVVYRPEEGSGDRTLESMNSKLLIEKVWEQEGQESFSGADLRLGIEKIEYMVINERKFRVKISLKGELCQELVEEFQAFEGLEGEKIQLKKETIQITDMAMKKEETLTIDQAIPYKEAGKPSQILAQSITIIPGYKQITGEKIVLNGFVCVNMLLVVTGEDGRCYPEQFQGKVEFTQFIPIEKTGPWSGSNIVFDDSNLKAQIKESDEGQCEIRICGDIITWVQLYQNTEKEIVMDGYHMKDDLEFKRQKVEYSTLIGNGVCEVSCREIVNIQEISKSTKRVVYAEAKQPVLQYEAGQGKSLVEGKLSANILCQDEEEGYHSINLEFPINSSIDVPGAKEGDRVSATTVIKDVWAEKINNSQIEFNCTLVVNVQVMERCQTHIIKDPLLIKAQRDDGGAMIVYVARKDDKLWDIAKRYKTTMAELSQLNDLTGEGLLENEKILIVK